SFAERGSRTRKRIAKVEEAHVDVRISGRGASHKPRIPLEIGVLEHEVECAEFGVAPDRGIGAESDFLNRAVLTVAGNRTVSDKAIVGFTRKVFGHINSAIVCIELMLAHGCFETGDRRAGTSQRDIAIGPDDEIRSLTEDVSATAGAPVVVR